MDNHEKPVRANSIDVSKKIACNFGGTFLIAMIDVNVLQGRETEIAAASCVQSRKLGWEDASLLARSEKKELVTAMSRGDKSESEYGLAVRHKSRERRNKQRYYFFAHVRDGKFHLLSCDDGNRSSVKRVIFFFEYWHKQITAKIRKYILKTILTSHVTNAKRLWIRIWNHGELKQVLLNVKVRNAYCSTWDVNSHVYK